MKKHLSTIILITIFIVGLSVLLYPTISNYINSLTQTRAITQYEEAIIDLDNDKYDALLNEAREYNKALLSKENRYYFTDEELAYYNSLLNINDNGMMGYLEIPVIGVRLPVYHDTEEKTLQHGVGHIAGTSLPVGGASTHSSLSGHRGLPSSMLLTDLDQMQIGDKFMVSILGETLTYQVDQIIVVEPDDMSGLEIVANMDYMTLVTCTPYGINTHRMLVRGYRVANDPSNWDVTTRISTDARQLDSMLIAPIIAAPILLFLLIYILVRYRKNKGKGADK